MSTSDLNNVYAVQQTIRHPSRSNLDIYTSVAQPPTTDTSLRCAYIIAGVVFALSCVISLTPAVYVIASMHTTTSQRDATTTTSSYGSGGGQNTSNWTLCWACQGDNSCCVNISNSESMCHAMETSSHGQHSCINKDLALHMLLTAGQEGDDRKENVIEGWKPIHRADKTNNITIPNRGLYVFYAKLAYRCFEANQTLVYESHIVVNNKPLVVHAHRQNELGTDASHGNNICHNAFMIATANLYRNDVVQVKSRRSRRIVSEGALSYFGYYRIG